MTNVNAESANGEAVPNPKAWNKYPLYEVKRDRDHIDHLYLIGQLAGVGLAASDSANKLAHMQSNLEGLFEVIDRLAGEAVEMAEYERARHEQ